MTDDSRERFWKRNAARQSAQRSALDDQAERVKGLADQVRVAYQASIGATTGEELRRLRAHWLRLSDQWSTASEQLADAIRRYEAAYGKRRDCEESP